MTSEVPSGKTSNFQHTDSDQGIGQATLASGVLSSLKGGVTSYLEVTTAHSAALSDEVTAVNILGRRMVDAVTLVQALGGGWDRSTLPERPECCGNLTGTSR
jgi:hypothetical protein